MVKFLRYNKIFRVYELIQPYLKYSLPVEESLPEKDVLILAPHADDESIGCGGTVYLHTKNGGRAEAVFCTQDGDIRKKEAESAAKILGISRTICLDYQVESLAGQDTLAGKLSEIFDDRKPGVVFVPFHIDNHTDHRAVNEALIKVYKKKKYDFLIYAYPVWLPLYPNVMVDISKAWEEKKKAIGSYHSQIATRDYVSMSQSLSRYWGAVKGRKIDLAETFFRATFGEYVSLGEKIFGK